jgi:site-specific recombinase XerD
LTTSHSRPTLSPPTYLLWFLEWFAARGYSPRTIELRADALKRFIRWCDERGITRPQEVTLAETARNQGAVASWNWIAFHD